MRGGGPQCHPLTCSSYHKACQHSRDQHRALCLTLDSYQPLSSVLAPLHLAGGLAQGSFRAAEPTEASAPGEEAHADKAAWRSEPGP